MILLIHSFVYHCSAMLSPIGVKTLEYTGTNSQKQGNGFVWKILCLLYLLLYLASGVEWGGGVGVGSGHACKCICIALRISSCISEPNKTFVPQSFINQQGFIL